METKHTLKDELIYLTQWLHRNLGYIIISNLIICFLYCSWIFDSTSIADTLLYINSPGATHNWLEIGREGAVLTKWLFGLIWYNPYVATAFGYIFTIFGGTLFGYIGYRCSKTCEKIWAFTPLMFLSPMFTQQQYFKLQNLEIGWGYILCAVAVGLNIFAIFKRKRIIYFFTIPTMIWAFSTYQIFIVMYVTIVGFSYILLCQSNTISDNRKDISWLSYILEHIAVFVIAFGMEEFISHKFFYSGEYYLDLQIGWKTTSVMQCIRNIEQHLSLIFTGGDNPLYTPTYGILSTLTVIVIMLDFFSNNKLYKFVNIIAIVFLQLSPAFLTIYLGSIPGARTQLIYPLVIIFNGLICYTTFSEKKWRDIGRLVISVVLIVSVWSQVLTTMRLIYTDKIRLDEDVRLVQAIEAQIVNIDATNKPVVFIGQYDNRLNSACLRSEYIGISFFNLFSWAEPLYTENSRQISEQLNSMGIASMPPTYEQGEEARRLAVNMPSWPARDSVMDAGDFVIVKLGIDNWAEEVLSNSLTEISNEYIQYTDDLMVATDPISIYENELKITGWCFAQGIESSSVVPKVVLKHKVNNQYYMVGTAATSRYELEEVFENGYLYKYGGFIAKVSLDEVNESLDDFSLCIGYEKSGTYCLKDIGCLGDIISNQ